MSGVVSDSSSKKSPDELSDVERAAIFAAANTRSSRSDAFRAGRAPVPKTALRWVIALVVLLGVGGILGDHFFPGVGKPPANNLNVKPSLSITTTPSPTSSNSIESLQAFMNLKFIDSASAKNFTLTTQSGATWSLDDQRSKVIVLTFFDATCNDICPILGAEIQLASQQLGAYSSRVEFVVVNSDPRHTRISHDVAALQVPRLADVPSVTFLSGSVNELDRVWTDYGILVTVGSKANEVSHNNALYFIGPRGNIEAYGVPPAQEDSFGQYSLSESVIHRYAEGIAATVKGMLQ